MTYAMRNDKMGRPVPLPKQRCSDCSTPILPEFKGGRAAETWFWRECSTCREPVCCACSDDRPDDRSDSPEDFVSAQGVSDDGDGGYVACITCLNSPNHPWHHPEASP